MSRIVKCTPGNKTCGSRCIKNDWKCGEDDTPEPVERTRAAVLEAKTKTKKFYKENTALVLGVVGGVGIAAIAGVTYDHYKSTEGWGDVKGAKDRKDIKSELKPGDMIRIQFNVLPGEKGPENKAHQKLGRAPHHYAIYTGDGKAIQYAAVGGKGIKGSRAAILESNIADEEKGTGYKWEKVETGSKFSPEEIVRRAEKLKGRKVTYDIYNNNCEHFARLVVEGSARSYQSERGKTASLKVAGALTWLMLRERDGLSKRDVIQLMDFSEYSGVEAVLNKIREDLGKAGEVAKKLSKGDKRLEIRHLTCWLKSYIYSKSFG